MPNITEKEAEIGRRIAEGESVEDVGKALHMGVTTVRFHIRVLGWKLPGNGKPLVRIVRYFSRQAA